MRWLTWFVCAQFVFALRLLSQPCYEWVQRHDVGSPGDRAGHSLAYDTHRNVTVFFGGDLKGDDPEHFFDETWEYDGISWQRVTIDGPVPPRRTDAAMAYDEARRYMILAGGLNHNGYLRDTWIFESTGPLRGTWRFAGDLPSGNLPAERAGHTLTYDENLQQVVLVGGHLEVDSGFLNLGTSFYAHQEVAVWNGTAWVAYPRGGLMFTMGWNPPGSSNGRLGLSWQAAAYDPNLKNIVIFGGLLGCAYNNDVCDPDNQQENPYTVALNPDTGIDIVVDTHPVFDRTQQAEMVYDRDRQRFVAYGGFSLDARNPGPNSYELVPTGNASRPYDKQFRDGSAIISYRARHAMVYDRHRKRTVMYGGALGDLRFSDTWELVPAPTPIFQQPAGSYTNCVGEPLVIPVVVGVTPGYNFYFQWQKEGLPVSGATSNSLFLEALTSADAGEYRLRILNQCGIITFSVPTRVVVHDKPTITTFDATRQNRCPGESATFSVSATSPLPMRLQWFRDSQGLVGQTNATIQLENLKHEDTGDYWVQISNDCGTSTSPRAKLQVGVTISSQPATHSAPVCDATLFSVQADGVGTLRYQWRLDNTPLTNSARFFGITTRNLQVGPLLYSHEGNYDVVITDDCGALHAVTSRVAVLTVTPGAEWVLRATNGPSHRFHHSMVYDSRRGVTVLFGGQTNFSGIFPFNDLWEWDGARWTMRVPNSVSNGWTQMPQRGWVPTFRDQPVRRSRFGMAYDSRRGRVVMFGGLGLAPDQSVANLRDLWEWDGARWYFCSTNGPIARMDCSMTYDERRGGVVLLGGQPTPASGEQSDHNVVWEWDGENWFKIEATGGPTRANNFADAAYDSFRGVAILGPAEPEGIFWSGWEFWEWSGTNWSRNTSVLQSLLGTTLGSLIFDRQRRRALFFSGLNSTPQEDGGYYDGNHWVPLTSSTAALPESRVAAAMAYDARRNAAVLFGGSTTYGGSTGATNDTWELISVDLPVILQQPLSQYRNSTEGAIFTVTAVGPGPLTYQWYRRSASGQLTPLPQTEPWLSVQPVQAHDLGEYIVAVGNQCGTTLSRPAILTTDPALQIFSVENTTALVWSPASNVVLQEAENLNGPWTAVLNPPIPFHLAPLGPNRFYRLHRTGE